MEMVKKTYRIVFHTLIFLVYVVFFPVQSFFNFEGLSSSQDVSQYCSLLCTASRAGTVAKDQPLRPSARHKTRLNKRFHQENMPPCDVISIAIPERYIPLQTPDYYKGIDLPSAVSVTYPLRGPPVVA